jgi:hypothetical protein
MRRIGSVCVCLSVFHCLVLLLLLLLLLSYRDAAMTRTLFEEMHHLDTAGYRAGLTQGMSGDEIRSAAMHTSAPQFKHNMFKGAARPGDPVGDHYYRFFHIIYL